MVNYSEKEGLNSSYTYKLNQDCNGFIWIGSDNGLFRFDGKEFKQYDKKSGLKNLEILACFPMSNGEIFIAPFLNDFAYIKDGKVINSDVNRELKKINFIHNSNFFYQDTESLITFNTFAPKNIYIYRHGKIKVIPISLNSRLLKNGYAFGIDMSKNLLYISDQDRESKVMAYDIKTRKIIPYNIPVKKSRLIQRKGDFFLFSRDHGFDVYKQEGKFHFRKIQSFSTHENIYQQYIDRNYRVWLSLEKGGTLYFRESLLENRKFTAPVRFLDNYVINDVMVDRDNNVWFSTKNNGIYFIAHRFFRNYVHSPVKNNSAYITAIAKNDKNIIVGYNEAKSGILHTDAIEDILLEKDRKIEHKAIYAKGDIIIFGMSLGIVQYNTATKKKSLLRYYGLKNMIPFGDDSVLFCTSEDLVIYNYITRTYVEGKSKERVYTALPYAKDSLFFGSFRDLYKLNIRTKRKKLFLEGYYFKDLKQLKPNVYVGATNLNGIVLFNSKGVIRKITENDGLVTSQIKKIEVENGNTFWASSNSGLSRIEIRNNRLRINNFTQTDGLPSKVVNGCVIRNDTVYAGTSKGLGILPVRDLISQQKFVNKKAIINSVVIGNREIFDLKNGILTQTPANDLTFNLSFPDYASQGNISYKYKIEGLNSCWQTSNASKIIFNSIPPGKYVFRVLGLDYNGKQSYASTDLPFEIEPHFWQTWWFKLLSISAVSSVLLVLITLYLQKKRNKKMEKLYYEKKIAELELQAIKAQINPHFIYNCLNSIQFLLYKKDYPETENYLDVFAQIIRKTLHYSEKTFMPIKEETEYLSLYLNMEKLRLKEEFDYTIKVSEKVNKNWVIPSLLIQPFVENAIKHGVASLKDRKGHIEISFDFTGHSLCIVIEDNGVGIDNRPGGAGRSDSFGVKLSQKRIETFKQLFDTDIILEINNLSEKEQRPGTQIKLYIIPYENQSTNMHH
ncbi:sensor histidine kinase [Chryseobacterium gossypii]|uniref:sensor histidine kinase n=1 Tax=Chryseobacterium gossypii TaxID=3231602 RepID=UPI003525208B